MPPQRLGREGLALTGGGRRGRRAGAAARERHQARSRRARRSREGRRCLLIKACVCDVEGLVTNWRVRLWQLVAMALRPELAGMLHASAVDLYIL